MSIDSSKVSYIPNQEKRWSVSSDNESRLRIKTLIDSKHRLEEELSGSVPIGVTLFGSLSKGKELNEQSRKSADIDLCVFYDIEELQVHALEILKNNPDGELVKFYQTRLNELEIANKGMLSLSSSFNGKSDWIIYTRQGKAIQAAVEDLIVSVFNKEIADQTDVNMIENFRKGFHVFPIAKDGVASIFNDVYNFDEAMDEPRYLEISKYFHLDVGGGVRPYIKSFLVQLSEMPEEEREELWALVDRATRNVERRGDVPEKLDSKFPRTYEDAVKFYNIGN